MHEACYTYSWNSHRRFNDFWYGMIWKNKLSEVSIVDFSRVGWRKSFNKKTQDACFLRKEQFSLQKETFPVIQKKVQMSMWEMIFLNQAYEVDYESDSRTL